MANDPATPGSTSAERPPTGEKTAVKPRPVTARAEPSQQRRQTVQEELEVLIRARYPIIYVVSWEEERVERCLRQIAEARNKKLFVWTLTQGIVRSGNRTTRPFVGETRTPRPRRILSGR